MCQVIDSNTGLVISEFLTAYRSYNTQYPPPISDDGKRIVFGDWYIGTYCYSVPDGRLMWKKGPGMVQDVFFSHDNTSVFVYMCNRGVYQLKVDTGEIVQQIKMSGIESFHFDETRTWLFVGPKNLYYFLYDVPTLTMTHKIPKRAMDVNRCLSFIITAVARFSNDSLAVTGWESYPNMTYYRDPKHPLGKANAFTRIIELSGYAV